VRCDYENGILYPQVRQILEKHGWLVEKTHGNLYQFGWPDLLIARSGTVKWIELKSSLKDKLRSSQCQRFGLWHRYGVKIYVICREYVPVIERIIDGEPNWMGFIR
jgi:hypothetical protein